MKRWMIFAAVALIVLLLNTPSLQASSLLQANSEGDDAAYRAAIAGFMGPGSAVNYFDTRFGTPTLSQLLPYAAVSTWANYAHADRVGLGNVLADYVDAGGVVILSSFSTFTSGNYLAGRIMTSGYSPVYSPTGGNHFSSSPYAGDGSLFYSGVGGLTAAYRDRLALQGAGVADGHYADGEILVAYRPDFHVFYMNGTGNNALGSTGDWARLEANLATYAGTGVPEPSTLALTVLGVAAFAAVRRRRKS
jgi:hypothetical protein